MTHGLSTYIFIDENNVVLEERELGDEEAAEQACESLVRIYNKQIRAYKEIVIVEPDEIKKAQDG